VNAGIVRTLATLEEVVTTSLGLVRVTLPAGHEDARGELRAAPARATTRAYASPGGGPVAYARFATFTGKDLAIGNALAVGHPHAGVPLLGIDLVSVTTDAITVVGDASLVVPRGALFDAQLGALARAHARREPLPPAGPLPPFCAAFFSEHHVFTRYCPSNPAGRVTGEAAERALVGLARAWLDAIALSRGERVDSSAVARVQDAYLEAHRNDPLLFGPLARAFGREWAVGYIEETLFPRSASTADVPRASRLGADTHAVRQEAVT